MKGFSWKQQIKDSELHLLEREKTLAKTSVEFQAVHPNEARDAKLNKFTDLIARMKLSYSKNQDRLKLRAEKRFPHAK